MTQTNDTAVVFYAIEFQMADGTRQMCALNGQVYVTPRHDYAERNAQTFSGYDSQIIGYDVKPWDQGGMTTSNVIITPDDPQSLINDAIDSDPGEADEEYLPAVRYCEKCGRIATLSGICEICDCDTTNLVTDPVYDNDGTQIGEVNYSNYTNQWAYRLPGHVTWNSVFDTRDAAITALKTRHVVTCRTCADPLTTPQERTAGQCATCHEIDEFEEPSTWALVTGMWG